MSSCSIRLAFCCLLALLLECASFAGELPPVLIGKGDGNVIRAAKDVASTRDQPGVVLIWGADGRDNWKRLETGTGASGQVTRGLLLGSASRSSSAMPAGGSPFLSASIDQLLGRSRVRGGPQFLTPTRGIHFNPKITIRRRAGKPGAEFPPVEAVITARSGLTIRVKFAQGAQTLKWSQIPSLPDAFKQGLPAGDYALRLNNKVEVTFTVASEAERAQFYPQSSHLNRLLHGDYPALAAQFQLEQLLDHDALSDALDLLDALPQQVLTTYLHNARDRLIKQLEGETEDKPQALKQPQNTDAPRLHGATGIAVIDQAREEIEANRWDDARATLAQKDANATPRAKALSYLYQAVILSEAGYAASSQADELFEKCIAALQHNNTAEPGDLFRAYNNYAAHLLSRTQDRLYNQAFQVATQQQNPLLTTLHDWLLAKNYWDKALAAAEGAPPAVAGLRVNLGRHFALLADIIHVIWQVTGAGELQQTEEAAVQAARRHVQAALTATGFAFDPLTHAVGNEVLAHLAYRGGNPEPCGRHALLAQQHYLNAGSLAGVESVQRLLGMLYARANAGGDRLDGGRALRHFEISNTLSEFLRQRVAADETGLTRAGFLARRAYVNEQIIGLLVESGKHRRALQFAEAAKARALEDVLIQRNLPHHREMTADFLTNWPGKTVAVAYYLGSQQGWGFVVSRSGEVSSFELHENGAPQLVADVTKFLGDMKLQASKMLQNRSFDHSWQAPLHRFCRELLPPEALAELRQADLVVFAPHHILHYLPFAALVTKADEKERGRFEVPQPRFLLDEGFDIVTAPSVTTWRSLREAGSAANGKVSAVGIVDFEFAPSLPGVERDLKNLRDVFGERVSKVIAGPDATESNVQRLLRRKGVLFFATHGQNLADRPLDSYLLCHTAAGSDGRLTAAEIFRGNIGAGLIIMSACYTGLADRTPMPGDDLFGLQRALLTAGAGAVISGVWDIYDGTAPLITKRLFQNLAKGESAAASLTAAQRGFLTEQRKLGASNPWTHPYFWAVYTLAGNDQAGIE